MAIRTLTLNQNYSGSTTSQIYFDTATGRYYSDSACTASIASVRAPTRECWIFLGFFSSSSASGGDQWIDENGNLTEAALTRTWTGNATWYGRWIRASYKITIQPNSGAVRTGVVYRSANGPGVWPNDRCDGEPLTSILLPVYTNYSCKGIYSASSGGTQLADADGNVLAAFNELAVTADRYVYPQWLANYKVSLNSHGGIGGTDAVWYDRNSRRFTTDAQSVNVVTSVEIPRYAGKVFEGYFSAETGGDRLIDGNGTIDADYAPTAASTLHAQWSDIQPGAIYTLRFNLNGGTGAADPMSVQVGVAVGELPSPKRQGHQFMGWYVGSDPLTPSTVWDRESDAVAVARWQRSTGVGAVVDYFNLASAALEPISSGSGDNKKRVCVNHTGRYEPGVNAAGGVWRNPTVTYRVISDLIFRVTFGTAFAGTGSGVSGYMITEAVVESHLGDFPTVTVSAVANEGRNAINLFAFECPIEANAHAQNLLGAIVGGGELQSCTVTAKVDPVVCEENLMPCASDVVRGRIVVKGDTMTVGDEAPPTAANGFVSIGEPKACAESTMPGYTINLQKEMT